MVGSEAIEGPANRRPKRNLITPIRAERPRSYGQLLLCLLFLHLAGTVHDQTMTIDITSAHSPEKLVEAFLGTVEHGIIPLTAIGVAGGNKLFGAAILRKDDLSLVIAATNQETSSPLLVRLSVLVAGKMRWKQERLELIR
jgi:hypothetical protein